MSRRHAEHRVTGRRPPCAQAVSSEGSPAVHKVRIALKRRLPMFRPFNVMQTFVIARNRLLRVYFDRQTLYFIRIGGQLAYAASGRKVIAGGAIALAAAGFAEWLA